MDAWMPCRSMTRFAVLIPAHPSSTSPRTEHARRRSRRARPTRTREKAHHSRWKTRASSLRLSSRSCSLLATLLLLRRRRARSARARAVGTDVLRPTGVGTAVRPVWAAHPGVGVREAGPAGGTVPEEKGRLAVARLLPLLRRRRLLSVGARAEGGTAWAGSEPGRAAGTAHAGHRGRERPAASEDRVLHVRREVHELVLDVHGQASEEVVRATAWRGHVARSPTACWASAARSAWTGSRTRASSSATTTATAAAAAAHTWWRRARTVERRSNVGRESAAHTHWRRALQPRGRAREQSRVNVEGQTSRVAASAGALTTACCCSKARGRRSAHAEADGDATRRSGLVRAESLMLLAEADARALGAVGTARAHGNAGTLRALQVHGNGGGRAASTGHMEARRVQTRRRLGHGAMTLVLRGLWRPAWLLSLLVLVEVGTCAGRRGSTLLLLLLWLRARLALLARR